MTGTERAAFAGVVSVISMSTVIAGYAALSTCPTSVLVVTGTPAIVCGSVRVTSHLTAGACFGTRP